MILLPNGRSVDFLCAAGALGFDGRGYPWEWPFVWTGLLRPQDLTVITKTLTYRAQQGNFRWWKPWDTFRLIPGGTVNTLGLPNMGYEEWIRSVYPKVRHHRGGVIVSISPRNAAEAEVMAGCLDGLRDLVAIEINLSCPNASDDYQNASVVTEARRATNHPLIAKLGHARCREGVRKLADLVDAFDLINSVPWGDVFPERPSPLTLGGGVSGDPIRGYARRALRDVMPCPRPVISGGGIDSAREVSLRHSLGARAFSLGTLIARRPWRVSRLVAECRSSWWYQEAKP